MEKHLMMDFADGSLLYQVFYVLAFLIAYAILIYEGYRRKFPLVSWILVLACIRIFVVVGTKIFSLSAADWRYMFEYHTFLQNPEKTMFGGILLGFAGYLLARHFLKFRQSVLDTVAIAFPVAISIQTIGCFFYGCCFGTASNLPWSVQYPVMTLPHYHQFESGLLTYTDLHSLPVHPVQLYLTVGGLLVAFLVFKLRKYWKAPGSLLLSSAILFASLRFILEFFRDSLSNKTGGEMLWIFKQVQWQYLVFGMLMAMILLWREKTVKVKPVAVTVELPGLNTRIGFLFFLLLILLLLRNWFTLPEILVLNIALLPAVFLVGVEIIREFKYLRFRWLYACSLVLPLFLMSQTVPQTQIDTAATKKYKTYRSIGGGIATGSYTDRRHVYSGSGCSTISDDEYFSQKYTAGGLGYQFTKISADNKERITYGVNAFFGNYIQTRQSDNYEINKWLFGVNPFIKLDSRWIGIGGGLHLGNLIYTRGDTRKENGSLPQEGYVKTPVFPQFYFRFGVQRYFFADVHIADQFPVSLPGLAYQVGLGTGFGLKNGTNLRIGFSFLENSAFYLSAYVPLKNRIVLQPLFLWTQKSIGLSYPVSLPEKQFSIGLSYRFDHR